MKLRKPSREAYIDLLDEVRDAAERHGMGFRRAMMRACLVVLRELGEDVSAWGEEPERLILPAAAGPRSTKPMKIAVENDPETLAGWLQEMSVGEMSEREVHGSSLKASIRSLSRRGAGVWSQAKSSRRGFWVVHRTE